MQMQMRMSDENTGLVGAKMAHQVVSRVLKSLGDWYWILKEETSVLERKTMTIFAHCSRNT